MQKGLRGLITGLTLLGGGFVPASRAAEPRLVVKVDNLAGFDEATVAKAEEIVARIFHGLGVQVVWQHAAEVGADQIGAGSNPDRPDLRINLVPVRAVAIGGKQDEVGSAALPADGQLGSRIWVFRPSLEVIIDDTQYLTPNRDQIYLRSVLLGHVMAHEMGHLLLGSAGHSGSGIMTLGWDLRKIRLACTGSLSFLPQQSEKIRAAVRARNSVRYASAGQPQR